MPKMLSRLSRLTGVEAVFDHAALPPARKPAIYSAKQLDTASLKVLEGGEGAHADLPALGF